MAAFREEMRLDFDAGFAATLEHRHARGDRHDAVVERVSDEARRRIGSHVSSGRMLDDQSL